MIKSMTGFGRGKYENDGRTYTVEIKSVNHKYSDISVKLPRFLNSIEDKIRKRIGEVISRGKVDVFISFENYSSKGTNIRINRELAKEYLSELKLLAEDANIKYDVNVIDITKFPEVLKIEDEDIEDIISVEIMNALNEALDNFVEMRTQEGTKLVEEVIERFKNKGFENINLTTYEFQAPEFYKKCGFEVEYVRKSKENSKLNKYFMVKYL